MIDEGAPLGGRYELLRRIGQGAVGDVFEARDVELGATVALKRFRQTSPDALLALKREFRTLAGVYEPGLVRLYDLVVDEMGAFFTMELVDGVDVVRFATASDVSETVAAFGRIADAVAALHRHGYVHCDLKPANILVGASGDVRVLDFGLAGPLGRGAGGTLAYMAPEVVLGGKTTPASDWYALGVVMYEALTGRLPSAGPVAERLLRLKARRFQRPHEIDARVPRAVSDLVWALLDPAPETRAGHGAFGDALGRNSQRTTLPSKKLVGRAAELAWLNERLTRALAGVVTVARIEGESGLGKSTLSRAFLSGEAARSCTVLAGAARPHESVPSRAVDAIVDDVVGELRALTVAEREGLLVELPRSLARAYPVFGALEARVDSPVAVDGAEARREAQAAFAALVARLAARRPVILVIDDVQWADDESLELAKRIATLAAGRVLLLLVGRPAPSLASNRWFVSLDTLTLPPFDADTARELVTALTYDRPLAQDVVERALVEANGNAFLLEFFARHAGAMGVASDLGRALTSVLGELDSGARMLFDCLALTEQPTPLAWLGRVVAERSALRDHVARLAAEGLVSVDVHDRLAPYHDAIREFASAAIDARRRRICHEALAKAFVASSAPLEWRIPHLEGAGRLRDACEASLATARDASSRYAFEIAAGYYDKALSLGELAPAERARAFDELAANLASAGRGRDASARYEQAATAYGEIGESELSLVMRQRGAIALLRSGALDEGRALLADALGSLGESLPRWPVLSAVTEAALVALTRRGRPARELTPEQRMRLETLWTTAVTLSLYDPLVANALTLRFVRQALRLGESSWTIRALSLESSFLAALGGRYRGQSHKRLDELRARRQSNLSPYDLAWISATEASTAWLGGDVKGCARGTTVAREAFLRARETTAHEFALLDTFRLPAMALIGEHVAARDGARAVIEAAEARGDEFAMLPCLHGHITAAYIALGDVDAARCAADRARDIGRRGESPMAAYHQTWSRAVLSLHEGDARGAMGALRVAWPRLRKLGMLRLESVTGDLRYVRGRCAVAASELRDAAAQSEWLRRSTLSFGAAAADSLDAQIALASGAIARGRDLAAHAADAFDAIGLSPDRDALRRIARGEEPLPLDRIYCNSMTCGSSVAGQGTYSTTTRSGVESERR